MQKFKEKACEVLEHIKKMHNPLVVHHYDCDGLTSGAIVLKGLMENQIKFSSLCVRKVDEQLIDEIKNNEEIIFVDLGASSKVIDELKNNVVVIDHHQMISKNHLQINPHMFGYDGGRDISASGTAYLVFENMEDIAIVGAIGDMQYPLQGPNKEILKIGEQKGKIQTTLDLRLYGKTTRPLPHMLSFSDYPYIPMITGNEKEAVKFLTEREIPIKNGEKWMTYFGLPKETRKKMAGFLIEYLTMWDINTDKVFGEVYLLNEWPKQSPYYVAEEFSTVLNACGRNGREDIGLKVCLRNQSAFKTAEQLLKLHKRNLREGVEYAKKNTVEFSNFYLLDGRGVINDSIIGVVIGMLFSTKRSKPQFGIADYNENEIKISGRALDAHNINIGQILNKVCEEIGGVGGGHKQAAGATIPKNKVNDFLIALNNEIEKTVNILQ